MNLHALRLLACLLLGCSVIACTAPAPAPTVQSAHPVASVAPSSPVAAGTPASKGTVQAGSLHGDPLSPDRSCGTDADCVVKNVGNCCGAMPACVNQGAYVDAQRVKAECARSGVASTCGFQEVEACTCDAGKCKVATPGALR